VSGFGDCIWDGSPGGQSLDGHSFNLCRICSRGWPCGTSTRGEALGPVTARCPSVGECQDREAGVGGLEQEAAGWDGEESLE
jgi:hypothetical protein